MEKKQKNNKAEYSVEVGFTRKLKIKAGSVEEARRIALMGLESLSVYPDDIVEAIHDDAYCAGALGSDPPLRHMKAHGMRMKCYRAKVLSVAKGGLNEVRKSRRG